MLKANNVYRKAKYSYTSRIHEINLKHSYKHVFLPSKHLSHKLQSRWCHAVRFLRQINNTGSCEKNESMERQVHNIKIEN